MSASRTLRQTLIVCRKELRDSLRDRRALWSILFSVVIGPVLVGFMMNKIDHSARRSRSESLSSFRQTMSV